MAKMWQSRLFRQSLFISSLVAAVSVVAALVIREQLARPHPAIQRILTLQLVFMGIVVLLILLAAIIHLWLVYDRFRPLLKGMAAVREAQYPLLLADGSDLFAELARGFNQMSEELRSREDKLKNWVGKTETEMLALQRNLEEEHEQLETILDRVGEGIIVLDSENRVLMANRGVCEIFGIPPEAMTRTNLETLIAQVRHRLVDPQGVEQKLRDLRKNPQLVDEIVLQLDAPGGQEIRIYCTPVRGADGKVLGLVATLLDLGKERELERLKTEFLSTISHELRTPLTSVKGALGLIRGGAAGPVSVDMKELLDIALPNVERLIAVINNILDIFSLERGEARMRLMPISLSQSAARAIQSVAREAQQTRITIENELPEDLPAVRGDSKRLEQVLVNLLLNAIKFSRPDQKIIVSGSTNGQMVTVAVQDFGRGISKDFMGRLFHKFEHPQGALTRESQGVGLGLAICRHILEAHGGRIWAESQEGQGSTFYFTLPVADGRAPQPVLESKSEEAKPAPPRLILVIDDDEDVARVISYVLESQGHRVISSRQGHEAVELARRHHPDLLTLDLNMPGMDGYTVLTLLRNAEETRKIPIICISVESDPAPAISRGADYYLEKPVDINKLREVADRALARP